MDNSEPDLHFREFSLWVRGYDCPKCDASKNFWGANRLVLEARIHTASSYVMLKSSSCLNTSEITSFLERLEAKRAESTSEDWSVWLSSFEGEAERCVNTRGRALFFQIDLDVTFAPVFEKHFIMWEIEEAELDNLIMQLKKIISQFPARGANS